MSSLKITGLQYDIVWKDKKQNFVHIEKMLASEVADLFLLPEMFPTGFCMDVEEIADAEGEVLEAMGLRFEVLRMDKRRIALVDVRRIEPDLPAA